MSTPLTSTLPLFEGPLFGVKQRNKGCGVDLGRSVPLSVLLGVLLGRLRGTEAGSQAEMLAEGTHPPVPSNLECLCHESV